MNIVLMSVTFCNSYYFLQYNLVYLEC